MKYTVLTIDSVGELWSKDWHGKKVKELSRKDYAEKHQKRFDDLHRAVQADGILEPLYVANDTLINGHHRYIVLRELGIESVPIMYAGYLSNVEESNGRREEAPSSQDGEFQGQAKDQGNP